MDPAARIEVIAAEIPCLGCGYNLRMQPVEGRCPECGSRVQWSLEDTLLQWGPAHLRRLARCATWVAVTAIAMPVMFVAGTLGISLLIRFLLLDPLLNPSDYETYALYRSLLQACGWLPVAILAVLHVAAIWRGTCPPPLKSLRTPEVCMRIGSLVLLALAFIPVGIMAFQTLNYSLSRTGSFERNWLYFLERAVAYSIPLFLAGSALCPWQAAAWLNAIYRRAGPPAPKALTQWSLWILSAGMLCLAFILAFIYILENSHGGVPRSFEIVISLSALASAGAVLVGAIGATIALFLFARRMRALAALAPACKDGFTSMRLDGASP